MQRAITRKISTQVSAEVEKKVSIQKYSNVHWSIFRTFKLNLKRMLPACCRTRCLKESTRDRMFRRGYSKLLREIEITRLLKSVRILKANLKKNYSKIQWRIQKL